MYMNMIDFLIIHFRRYDYAVFLLFSLFFVTQVFICNKNIKTLITFSIFESTLLCLIAYLIYFISIIVSLLAIFICLIFPSYFDHVEALIAATSWLTWNGLPTYPSWQHGQGIYGLLYGPVTYEINAISVGIFTSVLGSKIIGVLSIFATVIIEYLTFRKFFLKDNETLKILFLSILLSANAVYPDQINRGDSFILLLSALSIYIVTTFESLVACAIVGLCAGLAIGMKAHAFLYIAPSAALIVCKAPCTGESLARRLIVGISCAVMAVFLPFLWPGVRLEAFLQYLLGAAHQPILLGLIIRNLVLCGALAMLPIAAYLIRRPKLGHADKALQIATAVCMMLVAVIAGKVGAGPNHIYPFVPVIMVALVRILSAPTSEPAGRDTDLEGRNILNALLVLTAFSFGMGGVLKNLSPIEIGLSSAYQRATAESNELVRIVSKYPDAVMGVIV